MKKKKQKKKKKQCDKGQVTIFTGLDTFFPACLNLILESTSWPKVNLIGYI